MDAVKAKVWAKIKQAVLRSSGLLLQSLDVNKGQEHLLFANTTVMKTQLSLGYSNPHLLM